MIKMMSKSNFKAEIVAAKLLLKQDRNNRIMHLIVNIQLNNLKRKNLVLIKRKNLIQNLQEKANPARINRITYRVIKFHQILLADKRHTIK